MLRDVYVIFIVYLGYWTGILLYLIKDRLSLELFVSFVNDVMNQLEACKLGILFVYYEWNEGNNRIIWSRSRRRTLNTTNSYVCGNNSANLQVRLNVNSVTLIVATRHISSLYALAY